MPDGILPGTYTPVFGGPYQVLFNINPQVCYYLSFGTLVITSNVNNAIKGTFQGTMTDPAGGSIPCQNGTFTVQYHS